jgi:hypothetical protein
MNDFPEDLDFLQRMEEASLKCGEVTDEFSLSSGEKLPATIRNLGTLMSVFYRISCCAWGCNGGDHQIEWLVGRVTNQAAGSVQLIRSAYYDESLMLIRGIGEIANLLQLFSESTEEFERWKLSSKQERQKQFSPLAVRKKLENLETLLVIEQDRYQKLCEVGTHPVPGQAPGHFTGTGRPILGNLLQPVGVYVCYTELAFATSSCGISLVKILEIDKNHKQQIFDSSVKLIRSLGGFTILNYDELLAKAIKQSNTNIIS